MSGKEEKVNAKQLPTRLFVRHMEPGLCGYNDERVLITGETLKIMAPSFADKPVYVLHNPEPGRFMRGLTADMPTQPDGYVIKAFYNPLDGWMWAEIIITSDAAHEAVKAGWSVSNAYMPTAFLGEAGQHHNVDYDREIVDAQFTHLAIVPDPRYENAKIFTVGEFKAHQAEKEAALKELQNNKGVTRMFQFFRNKKEAVSGNDVTEDAFIEITNSKGEKVTVSLKEMVNAVEEDEKEKKNADDAKAKEAKEAEEKKNMLDSTVDVGGSAMKVGELVNKYLNAMDKKNSSDKDDKKDDGENKNSDDEAKKKEDEEKKNADDAKKKDEEEKENAKKAAAKAADERFNSLRDAPLKKLDTVKPDLSVDKIARGKSRYGSPE